MKFNLKQESHLVGKQPLKEHVTKTNDIHKCGFVKFHDKTSLKNPNYPKFFPIACEEIRRPLL
jgi:hypothetical protein